MGGLFWSLSGCVDKEGVATLGCIGVIMHNVVAFLLLASAIATIFMLIMAGIKFSLSGGDATKVSAARSTITYAIVGLALVFLSFIILKVIATVTGNTDIIQSNLQFQAPADNITP